MLTNSAAQKNREVSKGTISYILPREGPNQDEAQVSVEIRDIRFGQRAVGDREGEAVTLNNIGSVYDSLGERDRALAYYEQALPLRRAVGDRAGEAVTRFNIAIIYRESSRLEEAAAELRKVVELDAAVKHPDLESDRRVLAEVEAQLAHERGQSLH